MEKRTVETRLKRKLNFVLSHEEFIDPDVLEMLDTPIYGVREASPVTKRTPADGDSDRLIGPTDTKRHETVQPDLKAFDYEQQGLWDRILPEHQRERALQVFFEFIAGLVREQAFGRREGIMKDIKVQGLTIAVYDVARGKACALLQLLMYDTERRLKCIESLGRAGLLSEYGVELDIFNDLSDIHLEWANLRGARFNHADLRRAMLVDCDLQGARLNDANLTEASLLRSDLYSANMDGAVLKMANLTGADLREATFYLANLTGAILSQADLRSTKLDRANLRQTNLSQAKLAGTRFLEAKLEGADFTAAELDGSTILPDGQRWTERTDLSRYTDPRHPDFWKHPFDG